MLHRYFSEKPITETKTTLCGPEAHHLANVMRGRPGDQVTLFDNSGDEFVARVEQVGRKEVELTIEARVAVDREAGVSLTLAVALPKGPRQRWLIEKAVELGVARLVPLMTTRGVAAPSGGAIERLERAVIEASKQCGRNRLMEIGAGAKLAEVAATAPADWRRLLAHPGGTPLPTTAPREAAAGYLAAVGPEGGFAEEEVQAAVDAGWEMVNLGARILRVETAAAAIAARLLA